MGYISVSCFFPWVCTFSHPTIMRRFHFFLNSNNKNYNNSFFKIIENLHFFFLISLTFDLFSSAPYIFFQHTEIQGRHIFICVWLAFAKMSSAKKFHVHVGKELDFLFLKWLSFRNFRQRFQFMAESCIFLRPISDCASYATTRVWRRVLLFFKVSRFRKRNIM